MKPLDLVRAGIRHHARTHAGVVAGAAVAAAVLVGALLVGDSVRYSLRKQALLRIGRAGQVLAGGERFFRAVLADELEADACTTAPVLQLAGIATSRASDQRANDVQVLGVDARFFELAIAPPQATELPGPSEVLLNARLALQLDAKPGDELLLRVPKPSAMPRDLVMTPNDELSLGLRVKVKEILADDAYGRFGLAASQIPPLNAFVERAWLARELGLDDRANLIVAGGADAASLEAALRTAWSPADGQLELRDLSEIGVCELRSERVFLDRVVGDALARSELAATGVLTYFVNELRAGEHATPYSMVAALGPLTQHAAGSPPTGMDWSSVVPPDLADDEIVIDTWLAEDLAADAGDPVMLTYFVVNESGKLAVASRAFRVRSIVPIAGLAADRELMPAFSGLAESEHCRDWEPGVPIDLERIRDEDEAWWDEHKGTPKAFVSLAAGQDMWANRFGALTAVRCALEDRAALEGLLRAKLAPADLGLFFRDVRGPALAASVSATDFGGLFLGLSSFLIGAALLLTAMLFAFGVEQRAGEIGLLLAVGFRPGAVRRLFLCEATLLALVGVVLGSVLGIGYTRAVLGGLATIWRGAVGATALELHAVPGTIALGAGLALLCSVAAIGIAFRAPLRRPAQELLAGVVAPRGPRAGGTRASTAVLVLSLIACIALIASAGRGASAAAGAFFGAGALLLVAGVAASRIVLARSAHGERQTLGALGLRNALRRPGRSLATVALLASGSFLVMSVGANRLGLPPDPRERTSGTGGFTLIGNATLGVPQDLDTAEGRAAFALQPELFEGVSIVPLRVRAGDDASCLNLSLPQQPRLLGVRSAELAERGAFTFAAVHGGHPSDGTSPWSLLALDALTESIDNRALPIVPAIGDQASVTWTLHKRTGDVIEYRDELGRPFGVQIVATVASSILQGSLVIDERHFQERFPSESGYRSFLIDVPPERADAVAAALARGLSDVGLEVVPAATRLAELNAVQNTYLLIFQLLGALGLLLGSIGLGMVVLRNVLERRAELALLRAVGFGSRDVRQVVLSEHALLLALGLAAGALAALVALLPGLESGAAPSLAPILVILVAVALNGALWVRVATGLALRGPLLAALRRE